MVIINHGLQTLTNEVIIPHSGWESEPNEDSKPRDAEWTTVFKNTSGCLRWGWGGRLHRSHLCWTTVSGIAGKTFLCPKSCVIYPKLLMCVYMHKSTCLLPLFHVSAFLEIHLNNLGLSNFSIGGGKGHCWTKIMWDEGCTMEGN